MEFDPEERIRKHFKKIDNSNEKRAPQTIGKSKLSTLLGFIDIVLCGLVIHIADARMNEYGERVLFPFVGAPENHSAMSLMKSAVKLEVGLLQWLMNCIILVLSLCHFSFCSNPIMAS